MKQTYVKPSIEKVEVGDTLSRIVLPIPHRRFMFVIETTLKQEEILN